MLNVQSKWRYFLLKKLLFKDHNKRLVGTNSDIKTTTNNWEGLQEIVTSLTLKFTTTTNNW